ncbi:MAG: aminotransferase class I/II-fold pyridoxal phosphate-dependent enzyme [Patescibacteria group bacterium]
MNYKIPLSEPDITDLEKKAVAEVLETSSLSLGKKYKEFEKIMAKFSGVKYAVAVNSGTSGLHLVIKALGIAEGDEVITTPFSFIASANCILFEKAKPVFVDIKSDTFNINPELVEGSITPKTKAILAVDVFSQPADWNELKKIAEKHKLFLIEDSAEALGSEQNGKKCGSFGDAGIFAFYPNKQVTSVRYNTPVLIKKDGITKLAQIGSLMDFMIDNYWEPEGYECLSFNKDGKISWQKISAFIKHNINSEILKVCLEKGREVEITKSHSVFSVKNGEIKEVLGKDLKIDDYLVVPRRLPEPDKFIEEIDVLNHIDNKDNVKYDNEKIIIKNSGVGGGGGKYVNRRLKIDKEFCKLLGYFVSEGGYDMDKSGGGLRFTFGLHEKNTFAKEVKNIFISIWPNFKAVIMENKEERRCTVLCGGLLHSSLFKNLNCGKNVYEKNIPNVVWSTTNENKAAFIEGLLNGDGHKRIVNGCISRKLKVASENLANGFHYLLLTMGIQSRMERNKYYSKKGKLCYSYTCEILGHEQITAKENCIPISFLSFSDESSHIQKNRIDYKNSVSVGTINTWLNQKQINCPSFLLEDIAVLRIKKIEKKKFHEFVYDFKVKGFENFVGGYGAICLHNTGEGGMILTDNKKIYELCRSMANQGRKIENGKWLEHIMLGYNFRLDEMSCALGIAQMKRIKEILKKRENVAKIYSQKLKEIKDIEIPYINPKNKLSLFVYVVELPENLAGIKRDKIIEKMAEKGIQCGNYFQAIHLQPFYMEMFGYKKGDFPVCENISSRMLALPFFNNLKEKDINYIVKSLKEIALNA